MIRESESSLKAVLVGKLPPVIAREALMGRGKVIKALENNFRTKGHKDASVSMRDRYETSARNGPAIEDITRYEVEGAITSLVNTAPTVFWTLLLIYSHPGLLLALREELDPITTATTGDQGSVQNIDIASLKANCPLLISIF
jgi:hypothetical protein